MYIISPLKTIYVLYINEIKKNPQPTNQTKNPLLKFEIDDMIFVFLHFIQAFVKYLSRSNLYTAVFVNSINLLRKKHAFTVVPIKL